MLSKDSFWDSGDESPGEGWRGLDLLRDSHGSWHETLGAMDSDKEKRQAAWATPATHYRKARVKAGENVRY